jgi:hypothetical protein
LENYKYKDYFSITAADADGIFITTNVGDYRRHSDDMGFKIGTLDSWINHEGLGMTKPQPLQHDGGNCALPFYFIHDKAFFFILTFTVQ